jgi:lipopolysaccharide/colanic/teichoic acid biosynthesis glycosyltransferase
MYHFFKRILDIVIVLIALLLLSPLLIPVIILLLLTGEHQVFYLQKRIGYLGKPFNILKFATMLKNSPQIGTGEITLRNDPRVTVIGKLLRRTKINELPQILNVLKGEMSIVGPRPVMEVSYNLYTPEQQKLVYASKPGITGISSLIFRDEEKLLSAAADPRKLYNAIFPYKAALEIWYHEHASLRVDVLIIIITAIELIFGAKNLTEKVFKNLPPRPSFA